MSSHKRDCGQTAVITVLFMTVLLGMAGAVLDVGAWYRADRELQQTVDAAALAGAQELPDNPAGALLLAKEYADRNEGGVEITDISITTKLISNDSISVTGKKEAPGFFTKLFGIESVTVKSKARARTGVLSNARWAAPIAVDEKHPMLVAKAWGVATQLDLDTVGPGAFRLLNINGSYGGENPHTLGEWITRGYEGYMPLGWYYSDPGAKYNTNPAFKEALDEVIASGKEILLPIYRKTREQGAGFEYEVVGWVGFVVTGYNITGAKNNKIFGYFTQVIWEGIFSEEDSAEDFGARSVSLVE
jgi:hypothetical protein